MGIYTLTNFFMWCSVLNIALLIIAFLIIPVAGDFAYKLHSRWLPMKRETFNGAIYAFLGFYKILVFVFNIVPWIALSIVR